MHTAPRLTTHIGLMVLLAIATSLLLPASALAGSKSKKKAAKKAARQERKADRKERREDKKDTRRAAAVASNKGSCQTAASVTSDVWEYAGPILTDVMEKASPQTATAAQILKAVDKGVRAWNTLAGNSWARIGPRRLDFNQTMSGNVVGTTERMFVSSMPAFRPVTLDFYKVDGKGTAKVVVCLVPKNNRPRQVAVFYVEDKTRAGLVKRVTMRDAPGNLIKVVIHGKKFGTISVRYKVKATTATR